MSLQTEIIAWDGKSADDIRAIFQAYHVEPKFVEELISLMPKPLCQKGATWLIKAWLELGNQIEEGFSAEIFKCLASLEDWESKLHLLQSLPFLPIDDSHKKTLEVFLRKTLADENKFVRAWSYNGFYELAVQHPEYRGETQQFFEMALQDEAASVKARIRNLIKRDSGFLLKRN